MSRELSELIFHAQKFHAQNALVPVLVEEYAGDCEKQQPGIPGFLPNDPFRGYWLKIWISSMKAVSSPPP